MSRPTQSVAATPLACAVLMPHAPILVPGVGGSRQQGAAATMRSMAEVARRLTGGHPDGVVIISPHAPRQEDAFGIWSGARLSGSLELFDAPEAAVDLPNDLPLAEAIADEALRRGVATWWIPVGELDHGSVVPLWHLAAAGWQGPTVVLSLNAPGAGGLTALGQAIAAAAQRLGRRVAVVASGDMSHRLQPDAPGGFHPRARLFDREFIQLLRRGEYREVPRFDPELQALAGEDVVDSTTVALAAAGWDSAGHEVLTYEGPFGVGYGVACLFDPQPPGRAPLTTAAESDFARLPAIARASLEAAFGAHRPKCPEPDVESLRQLHGVFVTLRDRAGGLPGCVGTVSPEFANVVAETWHLARAAAFRDGRFASVSAGELPDLRIEVSVVHPPEPVSHERDLDPQRYGVVVSASDGRRGVLLPGIPGVDTVAEQLRIVRRKARIGPAEPVRLERFTVEKCSEPGFVETEG